MLSYLIPPIDSVRKRPLFYTQKRFAYYRFHKRVGKGSWSKYVERYKLPRSIENTQRLIFNYEPTYSEKKLSCSWQWLLPKKIAQATTSDEVLNVWVYYRHKRKKGYHYMKVLKRLVDVGLCSTSDWRFKLITSRIQNKINTFLNLPRICYYYGKLKATAQLENMTKMLNHRLNYYLPHQLILILKSFSLCKLQDKQLFHKIRDRLKPHISTIPFSYLSIIVQSYESCLIHDFLFLNLIADEVILRIKLCNEKNKDKLDKHYSDSVTRPEGRSEEEQQQEEDNDEDAILLYNLEKEENNFLEYKKEQFNYYPQMENLINITDSFSNLKFQNYIFFDYISRYTMYMLKNEGKNALNPYFIEKIVASFYKLKINDIALFEHILKHINVYTYDYPPQVLCAIGYYFSSILPIHYSIINHIFKKMMVYIYKNIEILNLDSLTKFSSFLHKGSMNNKMKKEFLFRINDIIKKRDNKNSKMIYDVPRLVEILAFHEILDPTTFQILCKHMHGNIKYFEPSDFNRAARALKNIKIKFNLKDEKIMNALARNVIKQHDLFHIIDYHQTCKSMLETNTLKDIYKIGLIKYHNNVPFYGFDELTLDCKIQNQEKKDNYRYKKGTIYFSNKKIQQEYPLHKSLSHL
ncbi:hypothetical protein, conserved [Plasmodium gonderi]|uniref:RAP domain-containing protein n=1 Tax=Plasmodium gonderi TaxID=77519 RepID=A0A1Y1JKT2_PLAGO|nr:hypothetical protein, conserved [Plasmodium gonderi]GAW80644.1 hypothetical protein, conserved [Plasmodium gonderi]